MALAVSLAGFLRLDNHSPSKLQPQEHSMMANVRQTTRSSAADKQLPFFAVTSWECSRSSSRVSLAVLRSFLSSCSPPAAPFPARSACPLPAAQALPPLCTDTPLRACSCASICQNLCQRGRNGSQQTKSGITAGSCWEQLCSAWQLLAH